MKDRIKIYEAKSREIEIHISKRFEHEVVKMIQNNIRIQELVRRGWYQLELGRVPNSQDRKWAADTFRGNWEFINSIAMIQHKQDLTLALLYWGDNQ